MRPRKALVDGLERALDDPVDQGHRDHRHRQACSPAAPTSASSIRRRRSREPNLLQLIDAVEALAEAGDRGDQRRLHGRRPRARARLPLPHRDAGRHAGTARSEDRPAAGRRRHAAAAARGRCGGRTADDRQRRPDPRRRTRSKHGLVERDRRAATRSTACCSSRAEVARRSKHPRLRDRSVALPPSVDAAAFFGAARAEVAKQTRGLPAPLKCVDAVEAAVAIAVRGRTGARARLFIELVQSPESKALRHAFFAERAAAKIPDVPEDTPTRPIRTAAVHRLRHDGRRHRDELCQRRHPGHGLRKGPGSARSRAGNLPAQLGSDGKERTHDGRRGRTARGTAEADARFQRHRQRRHRHRSRVRGHGRQAGHLRAARLR